MTLKSDHNHQNWYESVKLKVGLHCAKSEKFQLKAFLVVIFDKQRTLNVFAVQKCTTYFPSLQTKVRESRSCAQSSQQPPQHILTGLDWIALI